MVSPLAHGTRPLTLPLRGILTLVLGAGFDGCLAGGERVGVLTGVISSSFAKGKAKWMVVLD